MTGGKRVLEWGFGLEHTSLNGWLFANNTILNYASTTICMQTTVSNNFVHARESFTHHSIWILKVLTFHDGGGCCWEGKTNFIAFVLHTNDILLHQACYQHSLLTRTVSTTENRPQNGPFQLEFHHFLCRDCVFCLLLSSIFKPPEVDHFLCDFHFSF